jgi:EmrB/QacA subfamily drug resistance transporter
MPCKEVGTSSVAPPPSAALRNSHLGWVLAATVLGSGMEFIDGTVVNVALPNLQTSLGASGAQVQWVVEAYALFLSSLLLAGGALGDRFGLRRTFLCGVVCFALASAWCGLAPGVAQLLLARCLQGVAGALLVPNSLALLSAEFEGAGRGRAIGTWSGFASMMTALGPLLGGWMVQHGSWRWVFFLNLPVAAVTIWILVTKTKALPRSGKPAPLDITGAFLATVGLSGLTFSLLEWSSPHAWSRWMGAIGLVSLVVFVLVERRAPSALVPMELFRSRSFTGANVLTFFLYGALPAMLFYLPLNLIQVQGYSPTRAGAAILPLVLLMFLLSRWAGGLVERYGARGPLVVGPMVAAAGFCLFARPEVGGSYWMNWFPAVMVLGVGMTISVAPLTTVVMSSVEEGRAGAASGVNNAVSQTAALLALALSAPLFFARFSSGLPAQIAKAGAPASVARKVEVQEKRLGAIETDDARGRMAVDGAFVSAFRVMALEAAGSAAAAGIAALLTIKQTGERAVRSG